ncbi:Protein DSF2 [Sphaceloma murrayae]|uniref:Protein DSF2 n=1 Tax=Sphaceloma murrayae TaxID=2082308 RepID=A0A2K1QVQ5_9PEZI|nr:Protein DSF2 [Sphaceloma murrayae]
MSRRPGNLDLSDANKAPADLTSPKARYYLDLPSPRVGEVPPALSPLDAFAQHSRMLAKKFEESQKKGKRISRLDTLEVASEMGKRPTYFRSPSGTSEHAEVEQEEDEPLAPLPNLPIRHQTPASADRPMSHYPMFGTADEDSKRNTATSAMYYDAPEPPREPDNYFGIHVPRADSPEPYESKTVPTGPASPMVPSLTGSVDSLQSSQARTNTDESAAFHRHERSLAPPRSPPHLAGKKSLVSIRSVMDSADEELVPPRKFSESSQVSRARSPFTPDPQVASRSPSIMSDHSAFHDDFRRPSFNFSRPLSSSGNKDFSSFRPPLSQAHSFDSRPSHDAIRDKSPLRQASGSSTASRFSERGRYRGYDASSQSGDESPIDAQRNGSGAPSYTYAKFALPRGRTVDRNSAGARTSWIHNQFKWEDGATDTASSFGEPSPIMPSDGFNRPFKQALDIQKARSHSADGRGSTTPTRPSHRSTPSSPSVHSYSTDRTIRAHTKNSPSQEIANMSAEEHLEKGIECHSNGSLNKSTYHLRHAARAGHPTGMLMYALACRHGWGMRANQQEGVQWLKKAVDSSSLEMIEANDHSREGAQANKSRKAQYALAIYELGMSYMNGWGTPKDKALAVRCFEIAGNWGDCDALAEAGFCYTQGIGCKKDLKRAAALYRRAADMGMSMAGNSWIYKQKYMDEPAPSSATLVKSPNPSNSDRSTKGRSRARSLFGRKKSYVNA